MTRKELKIYLGNYILSKVEFDQLLIDINSKEEVWKDIKGFEGIYMVSNFGRVKLIRKRVSRPKLLKRRNEIIKKQGLNVWGYPTTGLYNKGTGGTKSVHRLVAIAFMPNPQNKPCVNHIDGNKLNNHISNLEWVTYSENEIHSQKVLGKKNYQPMKGKFGKAHNRSKEVWQCDLSGKKIRKFGSQLEASRETGVSVGNIGSCTIGVRKKAGGYIWKNEY